MVTVKSQNPASNQFKRRAIQVYDPFKIADLAVTNDLWLFRPESIYSTIVGGGIQQVNNLKNASAFVAASSAGRRPVFVQDDILEKQVAEFNADRNRELVRAVAASYASAFTMLVVSKQATINPTFSMIMGLYGTAPTTAWIGRNTTGGLAAYFGTGGNVTTPNDGEWVATLLSHDPVTKTIGLRTKNTDWTYDTYTTVTGATSLRFGQTAAQGFEGRIAMGGFFNSDFSNPANVSDFSAVRSMLDRYFAGKIEV